MPSTEELLGGFTIGEWEIHPGQGVFRRGDEEVRPEPLIFKVLYSLAMRDGECVTRDDLIEDAWDGRPTADDPINRSIAQLRGHLDDKARPHQYVETLHRRGYRLMQPVQLHARSSTVDDDVTPAPGIRRWKIVAGIMALGLLLSIALTMIERPVQAGIYSIAVLPIDNLSGDPAKQYIVDGIKNVLVRRLSEIPELSIKNTQVRYELEPSEIAARLEVDSVLTGAVQLQGSTLKVTYLVLRGDDDVTVGSGEVDGDLDGIFALQERLANAVRDDLVGKGAPKLITLYTPDSKAYDSYMRGIYAFEHRGEGDNLEQAIALFEESIGLDEYYGPAYLSLATAYALMPYYRDAPVDETSRLAIRTVEMGVAVDGNIQDAAGAVYGSVFHKQKMWSESEAAYQRAISANVVDSNAFNWYSRLLASVGRLDDALTQSLAAVAIDPDNAVNNSRVAIVYTWLGNSEEASRYFRRAISLGASGITTHDLPYALLLLRDGRYEEATEIAVDASTTERIDPQWVAPVFEGFRDPSKAEAGLRALDDAEDVLANEVLVTARTVLGDVDGAMAIATELEKPGESFQMDLLFTPELQPLREHPGFMPLLERLGIVAYWQQAGCTFDGHKAVCTAD